MTALFNPKLEKRRLFGRVLARELPVDPHTPADMLATLEKIDERRS